MSGGTRLLVAILGGLVAVAVIWVVATMVLRSREEPPPEPGKWPASQGTAFIDSCVKSCRAAPGVTPERYPLCDQACTCSADEAEKMVTAQELVDLYKGMQSGKPTKEQNEKLEKMKAAGVACAAPNKK